MHTLSLQRILGRGAMGTTYAAEFGPPNGDVSVRAVKVMKSAGTDRVVKELGHSICELFGVSGRHHEARGTVLDGLVYRADVGGDDRRAGTHRLEDGDRIRLIV